MRRISKRLLGFVVCILLLTTTLLTPVAYAAESIYELTFDNLFVFEQWANNANTGIAAVGTPGELTKDIAAGSFTLTNTSSDGTETYTSHSMSSLVGQYYMDIKPNTSYTMSFDVVGSVTNFESFMFYFDSTGTYISHENRFAINYNLNEWTFTTPENAEFAQLRFDNNSANSYATVSEIRLCETEIYEYSKDSVFRKTYTYSAGSVYGDLPVPERESLVFSGWYTGPDGTGEQITADTVMSASSYSLYAKWDPILVGELEVVSLPIKQTYCLGEKLNTKGLVIGVTYPDGSKENIDEGFKCSPSVLTETGTQTITVAYGSSSATFNVTVKNSDDTSIVLNNSTTSATIGNDTYTLNYSGTAFNRYELTYSSDAYVKGKMSFGGDVVEEFFLEPSENGKFSGYIDGYLDGTTQTTISDISFDVLNKDYMDFTLFSLDLSNDTIPDNMVYLSSSDYKIGVNLAWGGALTYLEDLKNSVVEAKDNSNSSSTIGVGLSSDFTGTYKEGGFTIPGTSTVIGGTTKDKYTTQGNVNLINCHDTGRLVQQSYYGTGDSSYVPGNYQTVSWPYNPVQGGNLFNEASKIVDLQVTENEIYIKCRPLDWAKEKEYITPSYMEAWYTLEDGLMRATCRFVDFSGYPSITTTQEFPAFYCVEPLKNFVYYTGGEAWSDSNTATTVTDLQFWGDAEYAAKQQYTCNENWGAFVGDTTSGYGIGIYAPGQTHMNAGVFNRDTITSLSTATALCDATSYIGVFDSFYFRSYTPISYCYYIATGNVDTMRSTFRTLAEHDEDICNATYTNGFCDMCGRYKAAELTTDKYDINDDGTKDSVYEIDTAGELFWFKDNVNNGSNTANAILTADITVNENVLSEDGTPDTASINYNWTPIGTSTLKYGGTFHGNGHTIRGLCHNNSTAQYAGLFGATSSSATIKEVAITDSYIYADSFVGAFCGSNAGTITNCYTTRTVINASSNAAGIAGSNSGTISNCYSTASICGSTYTGSICGNNSGTISNCHYLENSALNLSGIFQNGTGSSSENAVSDTDNQTISKTLDEFHSGEVAFLLQKYNSTQIWGQKSNSENSSPIFDYSGEYEVISVTDVDSYSVRSVGDIVDDDVIDVLDYQQIANLSVSGEAPSEDYRVLLLSDLNSDGYTDVLDTSLMALLVNGLRNGISVYPAGDFDFDGNAFTQTDVVAIKKGLINQNTLSTREKYACDLNSDGILDVNDKDILSAQAEIASKPIFIDITSTIIMKTKTANVIILSGQSNAYGASPLTSQIKTAVGDTDFENIKIKYNNINSDDGTNNWKTHYSNDSFETFRLGIGGQADAWFGPEVGLSYYLATNEATKDEIWYIIKYTAAGSFLGGNWVYDTNYNNANNSQNVYDGIGGYLSDTMITYVNSALDEIAAIHGADKINIRSFMWHQGESDSCFEAWANQYGDVQNILVNKVRNAFTSRDADAHIGFVDGGIAAYNSNTFVNPLTNAEQTYNNWVYSDTVNTHKTNNASLWYVPVATSKNIINKTSAGLYTNSSTSSAKLSNSIWIDTSTCKSKYENNNENGEYDGAHYCGESMFNIGQWYAYGMTQVSNL